MCLKPTNINRKTLLKFSQVVVTQEWTVIILITYFTVGTRNMKYEYCFVILKHEYVELDMTRVLVLSL